MNMMHIDDLDLTQIRLLAELSRSRSVSRAAQRIGVSQSAASHALAKLRKKLADPLFTRTQDGFQPTHERYVCIVRAGHPTFRAGMTLEGFKNAEHAVADATGMAHAVIDRFLARHRVARNVSLRVPGLHVLPMIVANSDLVAVVPSRLARAFAARV